MAHGAENTPDFALYGKSLPLHSQVLRSDKELHSEGGAGERGRGGGKEKVRWRVLNRRQCGSFAHEPGNKTELRSSFSFVTHQLWVWGKSLSFHVSQSPRPWNGSDNCTYLIGWPRALRRLV